MTRGSVQERPLRVLHINAGNLYGGVEKILETLALARHLAPVMQPEFAVSYDARSSAELRAAGAPVHVLGPVRVRQPWTVLSARRALGALLRKAQYDSVVCHSAWPHAIFAPVAARRGVPVVFWLHSATDGRHWTARWASRTPPALTICVSRDVAATAPRIFPGGRHEVLYAPMPEPGPRLSQHERASIRNELETPPECTVIVQVGRMDPMKGHGLHLDALGGMRDVPGWEAWFVGGARASEAAYLADLQSRARQLGIAERVKFLGERSDVPRLLASADVFCQPNRWSEGFSIVWMEAFQASLPIVAVRIGSAAEVIDDTCGRLVEPDDVAGLASALRSLVVDPERRRALGAAGAVRIRTLCDPPTQMQRLSGLLASVSRSRLAPDRSHDSEEILSPRGA